MLEYAAELRVWLTGRLFSTSEEKILAVRRERAGNEPILGGGGDRF